MVESYPARARGSRTSRRSTGDETAGAGARDGDRSGWNGREWITDGTGATGNPLHIDLLCRPRVRLHLRPRGPAARLLESARAERPPVDRPRRTASGATARPPDSRPGRRRRCAIARRPPTRSRPRRTRTIRELDLAHKLGTQGIVSSICPIDVNDNPTKDDPLYGYRPAVASIVDRLKNALTNQCLPRKLEPQEGTDDIPVPDPGDPRQHHSGEREQPRSRLRDVEVPRPLGARREHPPGVPSSGGDRMEVERGVRPAEWPIRRRSRRAR